MLCTHGFESRRCRASFFFLFVSPSSPAHPPGSTTLDTLPEWSRGSPAKRVCYARTGSNPVGVAHIFWRTCGLDGHDARFTRERSRVRVTARVSQQARNVFFFFQQKKHLRKREPSLPYLFCLLVGWRVPLQATKTVKSHERASPR